MSAPIQTAMDITAPNGPYTRTDCPTYTPWGPHQERTILMNGRDQYGSVTPVLWQVYTPGHGGTRVHAELAKIFLKGIPKACHEYGGSRLWYEEDIESAVPMFIFYNGLTDSCWLVNPNKPYPRDKLLDAVRKWMPGALDAVVQLARRFDEALLAQGTPLRSPLQQAVLA